MVEPFHLQDETYFLIENWREIQPNIYAGFTTKNGGTSQDPYTSNNMGLHVGDKNVHVVQNRKILANKIQFPLSNWVCCEQTHGTNVRYVTSIDQGKGTKIYENSIKNCDGIYTDTMNTLLVLAFADCVPIYFFAPENGFVGIVHAGWKGTVKNISRSIITQWKNLGIPVENILVAIGPSICKHCYIVDNKVINQVNKLSNIDGQMYYTQIEENQFKLDLQALNKALLQSEGILEQNIQVTNLCTNCNHSDFYSHRRDKGITGRMIGFIGIREALH